MKKFISLIFAAILIINPFLSMADPIQPISTKNLFSNLHKKPIKNKIKKTRTLANLPCPASQGCTGVSNADSSTITVAGPLSTAAQLTFSGAYSSTINFAGVSNLTFPSGTKTLSSNDGTNASGTWPISITGNAATVTTSANLSGDLTSVGNITTLGTVNSNVGTFGDATHTVTETVNGKGLITAVSNNLITPAGIGSPTNSGTGATGTWPISITGNSATSTQINVTSTSLGSTYYPVFVGSTGNQAPFINSTFNFSPMTGLNVANLQVGTIGATTFSNTNLILFGSDSSNTNAPGISTFTNADTYPLQNIFSFSHGNSAFSFDAYYTGSWLSAYSGSNFQAQSLGNKLNFNYSSGNAQGAAITWSTGASLNTSGVWNFPQLTASNLTATDASKNLVSGNLSGDITSAGLVTTLPTVNSNVGSFGNATQVGTFTANAKGQITAASNVTISGVAPGGPAGGDLSSTYPNPTVSKINGVTLGSATATAGNLLIGSGSQWVTNAVSGDATLSSAGAVTITKVNSVPFTSTSVTDGQINIGSTSGANMTAATLTGTSNEIMITNGSHSITLATPQAIATGSSPTFSGLTLSGLTQNSVIFSGASGALSQDTSNLFYESTPGKLSVHTGTANGAYNTLFFQVGASAADIGSYVPNNSPIVLTSKTNNGGSSPAAAEPVEVWMRQGVGGQSFANIVDWEISRSANVSSNSNTLLELGLTGSGGETETSTVQSWGNKAGVLQTTIGTPQTLAQSTLINVTGANNSASSGPHANFFTATDQYPLFQILPFVHDDINLSFDSYYDGAWRSSSTNGNFQIVKDTNLNLNYTVGGVAQGSVVTWLTGLKLDTSGDITIGKGNVLLSTVGKTISIKTGTNSCGGTGAVMVGGVITVNTTCAKTGDYIGVTKTASGGTSTTGEPVVTIVNNTSFTITGSGLDTSTWSWHIIHLT